jgi:hypothetical protein
MTQLRDSRQTFTYSVIMLPANGHPVRADAYTGGSPCRHQCAPDVRAVAGAATTIAAAAVAATAVTSLRTVRILASAGIHGIGVEPQPRRVNYPGRQRPPVRRDPVRRKTATSATKPAPGVRRTRRHAPWRCLCAPAGPHAIARALLSATRRCGGRLRIDGSITHLLGGGRGNLSFMTQLVIAGRDGRLSRGARPRNEASVTRPIADRRGDHRGDASGWQWG